jgi:hypothetical protein
MVVFCASLPRMPVAVSEAHQPIPASLASALEERTLIPFVGAGVSRSVICRSSRQPLFPLWTELLRLAADALERENLPAPAMIVRGLLGSNPPEYLEAAKRAKEQLGVRWTDFIRDQFEHDHGAVLPESLELARSIWTLGSKLIITTNYDHVLKWACASPSELAAWGTNQKAELAKLHRGLNLGPGGWPKRPTAWHLHGHIDNASELILAPDGYSRLYSSAQCEEGYKAALETLRHLLLGRTFLFVGFSLDDVAFTQTLQSVNEIYGGCGAQHFALIREAEAPRIEERVRGFAGPDRSIPRLRGTTAGLAQTASHMRRARRAILSCRREREHPRSGCCGTTAYEQSSSRSCSRNRCVTFQPDGAQHSDSRDLSGANTQLAGHFLELTPQKREDIAKRLGLLPPDYQSLGRIELAKRIFGAARQNCRLADLWTEVERIHPEGTPVPNPYAT